MASETEIATVFNVLTTNYGYIQRDKTPLELAGLLDIWKRTLADIDGELLRLAALKIISQSKWFPQVAELREAAVDIAEPGRRSGVEAWGDVVRAFGCGRGYAPPEFSDPLVMETVKVMGWRNLATSENQTADRARFIECYNALAQRKRNDMLALPEVRQAQQQLAERQRCVQRELAQEAVKQLAEAKRI